MQPDPRQCLESWAQELKSRSDRVRNLIGSAHWLSDGHHKEELVREFLVRHLPPRFRITRGFMCPAAPTALVSKEIDVLISDSEVELPWFCEGGLTIVPPASAVAQIHVKTKFTPKELTDVLLSGRHNQQVFDSCVTTRPLWFGAVFFSRDGASSLDDLKNIWSRAVSKLRKSGMKTNELPDCVVVVDGPVFLPDKVATHNGVQQSIRAYNCGPVAPAVLLSHLYDSITVVGKDSTRRGEWFRMITHVCKGKLETHIV